VVNFGVNAVWVVLAKGLLKNVGIWLEEERAEVAPVSLRRQDGGDGSKVPAGNDNAAEAAVGSSSDVRLATDSVPRRGDLFWG